MRRTTRHMQPTGTLTSPPPRRACRATRRNTSACSRLSRARHAPTISADPTPPPTSTPDTEWAERAEKYLREYFSEDVRLYLVHIRNSALSWEAHERSVNELLTRFLRNAPPASLWRKYEQAVEELGRVTRERDRAKNGGGEWCRIANEALHENEALRTRLTQLESEIEETKRRMDANAERYFKERDAHEITKARCAQLESALPGVVEALESLEVFEAHSGKTDHREWANHASTWLYPGDGLFHGDLKKWESALATLRPLLPSNAPEKPKL